MKIKSKPGPLTAPLPAVMVSCGDMENSNILTIAWTGIINSHPPITYVSVRKERFSHRIISETGEFVINLTTDDLAAAMDFCGVKSGRDIDKFRHLGLGYQIQDRHQVRVLHHRRAGEAEVTRERGKEYEVCSE